jgi:hypothetical protein
MVTSRPAIAFCSLLLAAACSEDNRDPFDPDAGGGVDAAAQTDASPPPDAEPACAGSLAECGSECVDTANDRDHCGACDRRCSPAAGCQSSACACPAPFVLPTASVAATEMLPSDPGVLTGVVGVVGVDTRIHGVLVAVGEDVPLGESLAMQSGVNVAILYDVDVGADTVRGAFLADTGTVTVTRRCAQGIAGTMQGVMLSEMDSATITPIPGGCTTAIASLGFDIGEACP